MTNNMNADLGADHSQRQGIEFKQTGSQTNDRNGFVGLEYVNASNFPVFRLGGYGGGMWDYCTYIASNAGLGLPYGTTTQRPVTNVTKAKVQQSSNLGIIRYNTTTKLVEVYTNHSGSNKWEPISCPPKGGTYLQIKNSIAPGTLWPGTTWVDTDVNNGCFIRQEGGQAGSFGLKQTQMILAHDHKIHLPSSGGTRNDAFRKGDRESAYYRSHGDYSSGVQWGETADNSLTEVSGAENRPDNVTVRF
jgi:hypothetical protein